MFLLRVLLLLAFKVIGFVDVVVDDVDRGKFVPFGVIPLSGGNLVESNGLNVLKFGVLVLLNVSFTCR